MANDEARLNLRWRQSETLPDWAVSRHTLELQPEATSAAAARLFLRTALEDCDSQAVEILAVLASELVTNAVLHARTPLQMAVVRGPQCLRVEVWDCSRRSLLLRTAGCAATSGRGLLIVSALAHRWGVDDMDGGKRVWAEVSLEDGERD